MEQLTAEQKIEFWDRARTDSVFHLRHVQGVETLEPFQEALLRAVEKYERVAVRSCHDMGKTWTMSKLVLWFLTTHPRAKIVTTAPTGRQVKLLLWSEIRAGHAKSRFPLGGELSTTEWKIAPDWWAIGFTTQKEASTGQGQQNSGFQGIHGEHVLVIFDEATGIPPDVWKQLEGLLTSANVRFVAIGNPTTKNCDFFKCFSDAAFKKLHFSCYDSPNLPANGIHDREDFLEEYQRLRELSEDERLERLESYKVVRPHLLTCKWVMSMALKWGPDYPLFVSKAEGEFPNEDDSCLMPLGMIEAAQRRPFDLSSAKHYFGVDVARFGSDKSVLTHMKGPNVYAPKTIVKRRTTEVSGAVIRMVNEIPENERLEGVVITVDATGIGSGVVDGFLEYQTGNLTWRAVEVREIHFGETYKVGRDGNESAVKERTEQFVNKKAEAFVLLADGLKSEITLPENESVYLEELPTILYKYDSKGRWVIEDKEAYKKRTKRGSPDYADSLALCNYGRYHRAGVGTFTADMAKTTGRPMAGPLGDDD